MKASFTAQKGRDASATIRGFVYQVERTLLAWLALDEDTILFCECGEDIDYVRNILDEKSGRPIEERTLEQVKYRQGTTLSLRSPEIIESLANFLVLRSGNPGHQLRFRFLTNATPAKEKGTKFPKGLSGLEAWQETRERSFDTGEIEATITEIRTIIGKSAEKRRGSHATISAVADFIASTANQQLLDQLIDPVEWAMGREEVEDLTPLTEGRLRELRYARSSQEAVELHARLFVHVFKKLSSPGEKRLDKSSLLEIIEKGTMATADRKLLETISALLKENIERTQSVTDKLESLTKGQYDIKQQTLEVGKRLQDIITELHTGAALAPRTIEHPRPDAPPLPPAVFTPRDSLVCLINNELQTHIWVTLQASVGMGKTQLARSIWDLWNNANRFWISCPLNRENLCRHIEEQLLCWHAEMTAEDEPREQSHARLKSVQEYAQAVASLAGSNTLLVIDNLPELPPGDTTADFLASLGAAFESMGGKLLTTSQHALPQQVLDVLGENVGTVYIPHMDKEDVRSMLRIAGAPTPLQDDTQCIFLLGVTMGHPILVAATVQWLKRGGWALNSHELESLLSGEPMANARGKTRRQVRLLVDDRLTRQLLDRLSIVGSPFGSDAVLAIGNTEPVIDQPIDRFGDLVGPWIRQLERSSFEVSPLLQGSWKEHLDLGLQQRLHSVVAHLYLDKGSGTVDDALQTCIHLFGARDWLTLAHFLMRVMMAVETPQQAEHVEWVRWFFQPEAQWPSDVPNNERIIIRAFQVRLQLICGKDYGAFETDLEQLIAGAGIEDAGIVAVARFHTGAVLEQAPPELTARRVMEAARALRKMKEPFSELISVHPEVMFWGAVIKLKAREQIKQLVPIIREMTYEERRLVFTVRPGPEMSVILADYCYLLEAEKEAACQDWDAVLDLLDELKELGRLDGAEPLFASCLRAHAIVLADYLDKEGDALQMLEEASVGSGEASLFLLTFTRACILLAKNRVEEAFEGFQQALSISIGGEDDYSFLYDESLKRGMHTATQTGHWGEARNWCISRLQRIRRGGMVDEYEYIEFLGELAWIYWRSDQRMKTCAAMHAAVLGLVSATETDNRRHKETRFKVGHVLGWLASVASTGKPVSHTSDGQPYVAPYPGIFLAEAKTEELPTPPGVYVLLSNLGALSSGVGCLRLATQCYSMAVKFAKDEGLLVYVASTNLEAAHLHSYKGDFRAAFTATLSGMRAMPVLQKHGGEAIWLKIDPDVDWERISKEDRISIEEVSVFHNVILPGFAMLLESDVGPIVALESVGLMKSALDSVREQLLIYDRWQDLIDVIKLAFDVGSKREDCILRLREIEPDENHKRLLLYMALPCQHDARPEDAAVAQAITLAYVNELATRCDARIQMSLSRWILRFWHREAAERSFRLRQPQRLREELVSIRETSELVSAAARLLLAVETASGAVYDSSTREQLRQITCTR